MKQLLQSILAALASRVIRRYQPVVVGITGSVGKTSTKEAIFTVLKTKYRVRRSEKSFNTEFGLPLTILGASHAGRNPFVWAKVLAAGVWQLISRVPYPDILVLEFGVQAPGDMDYLLRIAPPRIGVVTTMGETPVHVAYFLSPAALAAEKAKLVAAVPPDGSVVLSADDAIVRAMASGAKAPVFPYGFGPGAKLRISQYDLRIRMSGDDFAVDGISFKLAFGGSEVPVRLSRTVGRQQAYVAAAAAAVGMAFGMNLVEIAGALAAYEAPAGRLKCIRGKKGAWLLDDTYNASPIATLAALDVLSDIPAKRKIAVLGDMLELGRFTESAHRTIGDAVAEVADRFIGVGESMKVAIAAATREPEGGERRLARAMTYWFARPEQAARELERMLRPGDAVLIKGSQGIRMERVVEALMAEPAKAEELLTRQTVDWKKRS